MLTLLDIVTICLDKCLQELNVWNVPTMCLNTMYKMLYDTVLNFCTKCCVVLEYGLHGLGFQQLVASRKHSLRRLAPEVSQLGQFFRDFSAFYLNDPCLFFLPYNPHFSNFKNIGLKYSFHKIFEIFYYSSPIFWYIENAISTHVLPMKSLEECFSRQNFKPLYLHNEAYDVNFFLNKKVTFEKMSLQYISGANILNTLNLAC